MKGWKPGLKSMIWSRRKKQTFNQDRMKKQELKKTEEMLRNLWDNFKCSNISTIGVPEGEEKYQETKNLFEKIMEENFPNLAKQIDFRKSRKLREFQKSWTQKTQGTS